MLTLMIVSIVAYAATNVDNLTVLLAFLGASKGHPCPVMTGHVCGSLTPIAFALACAALLRPLPQTYIGALGIVPVGIGFIRLLKCSHPRRSACASTSGRNGAKPISALMVAVVAVSNGTDNVAVYIPLYAGRSVSEGVVITFTLIVMIGIGCFVASYLVSHKVLGCWVSHYGEVILPWLLIAVGISVLHKNGVIN